jgi:uncharacterized protein (TIGR00369 family)
MEFNQAFFDKINANALYCALGIRVEHVSNGRARSSLKPEFQICWPFADQPHGGVLFTLMDTTMAWAIMSQLDDGYNCTTIHLDIQFILPAKGALFTCTAWNTHRTGRLSFVRGDIHDSQQRLLASGQATFRIVKLDLFR